MRAEARVRSANGHILKLSDIHANTPMSDEEKVVFIDEPNDIAADPL
jgi:hypothetical protein